MRGGRAPSFGCDVFLQRQSSLGLDQLQSLAGLLVHHFEQGVLEDGVQLVASDLEFA